MVGAAYGRLAALDMTTGKTIWSRRDPWPVMSGTLATAGGVVFRGTQSGLAIALDDTTGEELWRFQTGGIPRGQPITYQLAGVQYVAMPTGGSGLLASLFGQNPQMTLGNSLVVFALPGVPRATDGRLLTAGSDFHRGLKSAHDGCSGRL